MKKRAVISPQVLPIRMPLTFTIALALAFDRIGAPGWIWGVAGCFVTVWWIVAVIDFWNRQHRLPVWQRSEKE